MNVIKKLSKVTVFTNRHIIFEETANWGLKRYFIKIVKL